MRGVVGQRQAFGKTLVLRLQLQSNRIGTAMEARDHVALAPHPFDVIRGGAFESGVEERLSETAHVDHDLEVAILSQRSQAKAQVPSQRRVESLQLQLPLLHRNLFQIFAQSHWNSPPQI